MTHSLSELMVANEFIAAQKDDALKRSLMEVIGNLRTKRKVTAATLTNSPLSEIVKKRTGMNIKFRVDRMQPYSAYINFIIVRLDSVLIDYSDVPDWYMQEFSSEVYSDLKKKNSDLTGGIDIKNSRVSGIFSEFEAQLYLGEDYYKNDSMFTTGEAAAVVLHELGHQFCNLMYSMEVVRTNMVLSSLNRFGYFNSDKNKKVEILANLEDVTGLEFDDKEAIAVSNDTLTYTILIKDIFKEPRSELKSCVMDNRTFEFISDQFATMHGAGGDLASALNKLDRLAGDVISSDKNTYILANLISILSTLIGPILFSTIIGGTLTIVTGGIGTLMFLTLYGLLSTFSIELYDSPLTRSRKIKEQLNSMLRERGLSKERKISILEDIDRIDRINKVVRENPLFLKFLMNSFLPWLRKKQKVAKLQHDYETIVNNELFAKAARLETL